METLTIKIPENKSTFVRQLLKELGVTILEGSAKNKTLALSPEQQQEIISSQKQINNGLFVTQSGLDDEIGKWLKK
ncbi:hypothetical protein J7E50_18795 [Pedobacter sp. ISL-68]|uniref:hypothetical protein n=1 Tax=unclassified Pedobacter TaxID=2628915 RepID=UPI001BE6E2BE|nr:MULTISPECIES: hypothetical protein [unclassified Pedobacter]MBT2559971.1 hypothetical protein [Pedobacter sp. ISL-64]MBT2592276.1 hypothetical protein [Pedobacter sp. ISL-68]